MPAFHPLDGVTQQRGSGVSRIRLLVPRPQLTLLPSSPPRCTAPPTAQGLPQGAGFPCACGGWGFSNGRLGGLAHALWARVPHCPGTMCTCKHQPPRPHSQHFKILPRFPPPCPRVKEEAGPLLHKALLLPARWILLPPVASRLRALHVPLLSSRVSISHFPLASSSTCKQAPASASISKHPPFSLLLTCTPFLTFPSLSNLSGHSSSALTSASQLLAAWPRPISEPALPGTAPLATGPVGGLCVSWSPFHLCDFSGPRASPALALCSSPEDPSCPALTSFQTQQPAQQLATASPRLAERHISSAQSGKAPVGFSPSLPVAAHYVLLFLVFLPDRKLCEGKDSLLCNVFMAAPQDFSWRLALEHPIFVESMKGQIHERINE